MISNEEICYTYGLEESQLIRWPFSLYWSINLTQYQSKSYRLYYTIWRVSSKHKDWSSQILEEKKKTTLEDSHYLNSRVSIKWH